MRPSEIKPGTKLLISSLSGLTDDKYIAIFQERVPKGPGGRKPYNVLKVPDFVGINGPDDEGICHMSDFDLSRRGAYYNSSSRAAPRKKRKSMHGKCS